MPASRTPVFVASCTASSSFSYRGLNANVHAVDYSSSATHHTTTTHLSITCNITLHYYTTTLHTTSYRLNRFLRLLLLHLNYLLLLSQRVKGGPICFTSTVRSCRSFLRRVTVFVLAHFALTRSAHRMLAAE